MEKANSLYITYREEDMLPYAYAYLNNNYPLLKKLNVYLKYDYEIFPDVLIEHIENDFTNSMAIKVKSSEIITEDHIQEFKNYSDIPLLNKSTSRIEKIFMVASSCDTSRVPEEIKVMYLKEYVAA